MNKKRTFAIVFVSGFFSLLVFAGLDGSWPDFDVWGLLIVIGGLVAISLASIWFQSAYDRQDR